MAEGLRLQLESVSGQKEGWQDDLGSLHSIGKAEGPDRDRVLQHLYSMPTAGSGFVYLILLHSLWMQEAEEIVASLNSWGLASRRQEGVLDARAMRILGIGDEDSFKAQALRMRDARAAYLKSSLDDLRQQHGRQRIFRIERALSGYLGEASVFSSHATQRPKVMFIPGLGTAGFLDPQSHPLVSTLRRSYLEVQAEFDRVLNEPRALKPFLGHVGPGAVDGYVTGGTGASWDAFFFYRHGQRFDDAHLQCPATSALLDSMDLCRIEDQSPEICFSVLQPGSRIEPHHGVTNARVVIHLPLRVPPGCRLELTQVGHHEWVEGEPLVFDDTFEHSAVNPNSMPRGILLMDAWHPALTLVEREAFRCLIKAVSSIECDRLLPGRGENV